MISLVISGGQTGADQAALRAARSAGIATGGCAPAGWMTEEGPAPWLADFGLLECPEPGYPARRRRCVAMADTMLLFGDRTSKGSVGLLRDWGRAGGKLYCHVAPGIATPRGVTDFLRGRSGAKVLMVAGNRESLAPGIGDRVEWFLVAVFRLLARPAEEPWQGPLPGPF